MRIHESQDLKEVVQMIHTLTEGRFGNVVAMAEGEKFDNCVPAAAGGGLVVGSNRYYCILISHWYLPSCPWGSEHYDWLAEVMPYEPFVEVDNEDGTTTQIPNTESYECGNIIDGDGISHAVKMGL
jgi:hypothetical protein